VNPLPLFSKKKRKKSSPQFRKRGGERRTLRFLESLALVGPGGKGEKRKGNELANR